MERAVENGFLRAAKAFHWASGRAFQLGLQASTGGNVSIRIGPDRFLTKPTGMGLYECQDSDLVLVDSQGDPLEGYGKPTKEVQVHMAVFQTRRDVGAIAHYHAPHATAFAVRGQTLPLPTVHARRILKQVPLVPEYPEGSSELASAAAIAFGDGEVAGLLMANHGLMAVGSDLEEAQYRAELMEESAKIAWLSKCITSARGASPA